MLDTGYWMLDTGCWMIEAGYWRKRSGAWRTEYSELSQHSQAGFITD